MNVESFPARGYLFAFEDFSLISCIHRTKDVEQSSRTKFGRCRVSYLDRRIGDRGCGWVFKCRFCLNYSLVSGGCWWNMSIVSRSFCNGRYLLCSVVGISLSWDYWLALPHWVFVVRTLLELRPVALPAAAPPVLHYLELWLIRGIVVDKEWC